MTKEVRAFEIESIPAANEELLGYIKSRLKFVESRQTAFLASAITSNLPTIVQEQVVSEKADGLLMKKENI